MGCLFPNSVRVGKNGPKENCSGIVGNIDDRGEFIRLLLLKYSFPEIFKIAPPSRTYLLILSKYFLGSIPCKVY